MMSFVFFLVDGHGFILGCFLLLIAACCASGEIKTLWISVVQILTAIGILLVAISGTPLPVFFYLLWLVSIIAMLGVQNNKERIKASKTLRLTTGFFCLLALLLEWPHWKQPSISPPPTGKIYVIGDSVSSGIHPNENTWSKILKQQYQIDITNLAEGGAVCQTAMVQAKKISGRNHWIILEIGGNDLLNRTPHNQYAIHLEKLLKYLSKNQHQMIMIELPAPPLKNYYAATQRQLAEKYQVSLIPKRNFTAILASKANTSDGIHLTAQGHKKMAEMIQKFIGQ